MVLAMTLDMAPKAQMSKAIINKWYHIELKSFLIGKETMNKVKRQPTDLYTGRRSLSNWASPVILPEFNSTVSGTLLPKIKQNNNGNTVWHLTPISQQLRDNSAQGSDFFVRTGAKRDPRKGIRGETFPLTLTQRRLLIPSNATAREDTSCRWGANESIPRTKEGKRVILHTYF